MPRHPPRPRPAASPLTERSAARRRRRASRAATHAPCPDARALQRQSARLSQTEQRPRARSLLRPSVARAARALPPPPPPPPPPRRLPPLPSVARALIPTPSETIELEFFHGFPARSATYFQEGLEHLTARSGNQGAAFAPDRERATFQAAGGCREARPRSLKVAAVLPSAVFSFFFSGFCEEVARANASQFAPDADADAAAGTTAAAGRAAAPASGRIEPARREGADLTRPTGRPRRRAHVALSKPSATPLRLPSRRLPCSLVAQAIDS